MGWWMMLVCFSLLVVSVTCGVLGWVCLFWFAWVYIGFVISSFCSEFGFEACWIDCLICWLVVGFVVCYFVLRCCPDG